MGNMSCVFLANVLTQTSAVVPAASRDSGVVDCGRNEPLHFRRALKDCSLKIKNKDPICVFESH